MNLRSFAEVLAGAILGGIIRMAFWKLTEVIPELGQPIFGEAVVTVHWDDLLSLVVVGLLWWKAPFKRIWAVAFGTLVGIEVYQWVAGTMGYSA